VKNLLIALLTALFLCSLLAAAQKETPKDPPLTSSEPIWIYGFIPEGAWVGHHYVLCNSHPDTITIVDLIASCDCTHLPRPPIVILPGQRYLLETSFDTRTYFGETNRDIHLVTNYKPNPEMELHFSSFIGKSPQAAVISPPSTAFIPGKDSQAFIIESKIDSTIKVIIHLDNDSSLTVSETVFSIAPMGKREITVSPIWSLFAPGDNYSSFVIEFLGNNPSRITVPVKINKY